jgi:hypothetical protein
MTSLQPEFREPPRRRREVRLLKSHAEAIAAAHEAAAAIVTDSVLRDRERRLPHREMDILSDAGLLAITVPRSTAAPK